MLWVLGVGFGGQGKGERLWVQYRSLNIEA